MNTPTVELNQNGVFQVDYGGIGVLSQATVQAQLEARRKLKEGKQKVLFLFPSIWRVDADAAQAMSSDSAEQVTEAAAAVVNSSLGMVALKVFEMYHRPPYPFRIFPTERDALDWLDSENRR
ncbi:MAG: hypothetical protein MUF30_02965 [Burkholderiales bacterium]|jgi:hypothetical protein|nr:hypothetical protein [Burkholderiales bacterium]